MARVRFIASPLHPHRCAAGNPAIGEKVIPPSGEALTRECLGHGGRLGSSAVFIDSGSWMHGADRLSRRLGCEFVPDRDWVYDPTIHLFGMHRPL